MNCDPAAETQLRWRLFDQIVEDVREAFADLAADELDNMTIDGVNDVRNGNGV